MENSRSQLSEVSSKCVPDKVPYAVVLPPGYDTGGPYPLCLVLHGGGGSHQNLFDAKPVFDQLWESGALPPVVLASAGTDPLSFYFDHPDGSFRCETFIAEDFLAHLHATYKVRRDRASNLITGVSMGGHGSLKIAFKRPGLFAAVAAMEPGIEPGLRSGDVGARNRFFFPAGGSASALFSENRDPALFEANNPASIASANADAIRASGLAIYLECGDHDLLNLHDGTEYLHRVLWDLDISHEYHLVRGGDHVGPTLAPRMREAYSWLGAVLKGPDPKADEVTPEERAWSKWATEGMKGAPPAVDLLSHGMVRMLR